MSWYLGPPPHPNSLVTVPMILVLPSRSSIVFPGFINSGLYLNENLTNPRSSLRSTCSSPYIYYRTTVCWMVPQCRTPSQCGLMVVEWCSTCISASNCIAGSGFSSPSITTIPLRMSFLTSLSFALADFRQRQTSSPAQASWRGTRLTWMDLTVTALNCFSLSGPIRQGLLTTTTPDLMMPDTIRPTPSTRKFSLISNSKVQLMASSMLISRGRSIIQRNSVRDSKPSLLTLETGKMGQTLPEGISSAVLANQFWEVLSVISMGNLLRSL